MLITGVEAVKIVGITPFNFIQLLDSGKIAPEFKDGRLFFDLHELRRLTLGAVAPFEFPADKYASPLQCMHILGVSRRTFYKKINAEGIQIHKAGRLSYIKIIDLYASNELF